MILDTNAVSFIAAEDRAIREVVPPDSRTYLPVIVLGEYRAGLIRSRIRGELERRLQNLVATSVILEVTSETADQYASITASLVRRSTPIPTNDIWIAALALQHSLWVVSNDAHFDNVEGLHRIGW